MAGDAKVVAQARIAELTGRGHDLVTFWRACTEAIAPAVPHYEGPCWFTLDPASLLVTSHFQDGMTEIPHEWLADEYYTDDFNKMAAVARSERGVATLHEATGGDPFRSPRYESTMLAYGAEQELVAALRTATGEVWGAVGLYREIGYDSFDGEDLAFMQAVAPCIAEGARRALLLGEATDPEHPDAPGLIVLDEQWRVESMTPGAERWLAELPDGDARSGRLPSSVLAVAGQALRVVAGDSADVDLAFARVPARSGGWIVVHGMVLVTGDSRRAAVIVAPAHPARIIPLLMAAFQLTDRERDVTRLVLQGRSTAEIAAALFVSAHTVQEHLKSVFAKTGVRSRRDLVGKVFFSHYEPRVRDNEDRAARQRPLRGGPVDNGVPLLGRDASHTGAVRREDIT